MDDEQEEWLKDRPECVQKLAEEFPPGTVVIMGGIPHYLLGYTESDKLIFSEIDPEIDFEAAMDTKFHLCAKHLRKERIH